MNVGKMGFPAWIGHRGAMGHAPENTRAAFEAGRRLGAGAVECDVRLSKEGRLVVIHDERLDRTTSGRGPVSKKNWAQLSALDAGSWFDPSFAGQRLWRLDDLLAWAKRQQTRARRPLQVVIEIKARPGAPVQLAPKVVALLKKTGMVRRALVISFHHGEAARSKRLCPGLRTGILFSETPTDLVRRMKKTGADAIFPRYNLINQTLMTDARRHGWLVGTWTVNEPDEMRRLRKLGVDGIATNFPDRAVALAGPKETIVA